MAIFSKNNLVVACLCASISFPLLAATPTSCVLLPNKTVELAAPVSGVVDKVFIERGDTVRAGQTVLQLNSEVENATVELAKARLEFTQRRLQRNQNLVSNQLLAAQEVDELKTENALARLELNQAKAVLAQRIVNSPLSGRVISVDSSVGEYVGTLGSEPFARIVNLDPLHVELVYPAKDYGKVTIGQSLSIQIQHQSSRVTGTVDIVDPLIDAASGTFGVRLVLPNPNSKIPAGLRCDIVN
jgi:RND family efflux transporter MFP subunit